MSNFSLAELKIHNERLHNGHGSNNNDPFRARDRTNQEAARKQVEYMRLHHPEVLSKRQLQPKANQTRNNETDSRIRIGEAVSFKVQRIRESKRRWRLKNKDKIKEHQRKYRQRCRERASQNAAEKMMERRKELSK